MEKIYTLAARMKLFAGYEKEYERRHRELWPALGALLKAKGIIEYFIFLDPETLTLFAVLKTSDPAMLDTLPAEPVMKQWWHYMKDIMETNEDESPVNIPLKEVFAFT